MEICRTVAKIQFALAQRKKFGHKIGFVPTMGALHDGHRSLLNRSRKENECVVCSIFVNPTQFTEKSDLSNYPRPIESDITLLQETSTDLLFLPYVEEIYPDEKSTQVSIDLNGLDKIMEAIYRPGHFEGVVQVVKRLLDIIDPDALYMGQKDFQQQTIIKHMIEWYKVPTELRICPIIREPNGLARSSRNERLNEALRSKAGIINESLNHIKKYWQEKFPNGLVEKAIDNINKGPFKVEYIEIVDGDTLLPKKEYSTSNVVVVCAAVWANDVRLIDNIILKDTHSIYRPIY